MTLRFNGAEIPCPQGSTVLDALIEADQSVEYSCKNGICQTCVLRADRGAVPAESQVGIKDTLKALGYFLPCVCLPEGSLEISVPEDADLLGRARVVSKETLSPSVSRLVIEPATPLYYRAGQFLNLRRDDGLTRSYSLASVPHLDPHLEFHIKTLPGGEMSTWIRDDVSPGQPLEFGGPNGACFYLPEHPEQNLLLIGNGTGLAPLIGIARDALHSSHHGDVYLYHGSRHVAGIYLHEDLLELQTLFPNFHYVPCLSGDAPPQGYRAGRAEAVALGDFPDLTNWRIYLCGYPPMVNAAQRKCYLAGARMDDIHADPFELKELRSSPRD
ncbi:2Fe-2S iron-sulfur cluster binding domain-containing protein [Pelagibius litoralis]|uniref:2Fe-2S iron-sulfur cluster binding domain-containing protein n=1 Tax=Pelagibius litoralis TaxID=374515 RepID=A0A967C1X0_9PROT|nr:FAD-binding oxidoreductase [Pelagibius litoralis]NIA67253.1 2Fe-2S iron-sulfur cluster binding domain-containing protein [Pelagibius litoralis]